MLSGSDIPVQMYTMCHRGGLLDVINEEELLLYSSCKACCS